MIETNYPFKDPKYKDYSESPTKNIKENQKIKRFKVSKKKPKKKIKM